LSTGIKTITKPKTITVIRDIVVQRLPLALLVLGVTSIGLIAAVDHISRSMRQAFLYTDVVHEMEIELSKAHLALEENLRGIQGQDIAPVWQGIDRTEEMASATLGGGQTLHGYRIKPLQDDSLRKNMERLRSLTVRFRELARNVYINSTSLPEINRMDSVYLADDNTLKYLVQLSNTHIHWQFQPSKSINILEQIAVDKSLLDDREVVITSAQLHTFAIVFLS